MTRIRTRFAPSPTGPLHIGGLRTALYSFALAKHSKGDFVLRIEDTDKKREIKGSKEKIKELLNLFGLAWDEYYVQSERASKGIYKKAAESLVASGHAFYCDCEARDSKKGYSKVLRDPCRDKSKTQGAIKLKVPEGETISFTDFVLKKEVSWDTTTLADTTLLKSDGFPTYHLAVVVDDHDMKISHALRGHDWMPSTPIHLLVYKYLGYELPEMGHLTDILDPVGGKLSKRKGSSSLEALLKEGYLPEAILNFIMLLGWAPKDDRELFTLEEFVETFDADGFQKSNPVFNKEKLDWFNGEYIRKTNNEELRAKTEKFLGGKYDPDLIAKTIPLVKERINKLSDYLSLAGFFFESVVPQKGALGKDADRHLNAAYETLNKLDKWDKAQIDASLMDIIEKEGFETGDFFMDLRVAITGKRVTPPISDSIVILGKQETLKRIKALL
jgi:glutamyl-tRNA synthetase